MRKEKLRGETIFLIHNFLTKDQCADFIRQSEEIGFDDAPINTTHGAEIRKDVRNNTRVMLDDPMLAEELWQRAQPFVPPEWMSRTPIGMNERLRFYKYEIGQRFAPHYDGRFNRENGERSEFSFLVYLNDDFEGGETVFFDPSQITVVPQVGTALVFYHPQLHEGATIYNGTKYVLRTDVMYSTD